MEKKNLSPATLCVQAGWTPTKGEPRVLPIYQSTTFKYDTSEQMARLFDLEDSGYFYTRLQNPTNDAVAAKIAALEGGVGAMLTSSGQAANFYAIFNICQAGDHFVCASTIYGGTFNLFAVTMKKLGIDCTFVDINAPEEELQKAFQPNTKALFGETISNPSIDVLDIEKFARIAHKNGVPLIVDNTFATPINYQELSKMAIYWADGVIENCENADPTLVEYARSLGKPVLEYKTGAEYADACSSFYNQLCEQE